MNGNFDTIIINCWGRKTHIDQTRILNNNLFLSFITWHWLSDCEMTRNVQPDLSIVIGQVNVKNINAPWLGSWVIICAPGNLESGESWTEKRPLTPNICTKYWGWWRWWRCVWLIIKNVFFWAANILLSEISRVSYHWWMSPSFVDGNGTISWYCQYFFARPRKNKFIFIECNIFMTYFTGWRWVCEVGGDVGGAV